MCVKIHLSDISVSSHIKLKRHRQFSTSLLTYNHKISHKQHPARHVEIIIESSILHLTYPSIQTNLARDIMKMLDTICHSNSVICYFYVKSSNLVCMEITTELNILKVVIVSGWTDQLRSVTDESGALLLPSSIQIYSDISSCLDRFVRCRTNVDRA